ncbi:MAG TPA: pilus assembly PilX N-terminal domain-containing protein [Acidobacteriota bacterium]|jgi:Tfp pilus assembly protein PilX|nr:pilus assembly PilX N-terminal domain-containing protein [Acidobacteriota bacterium]HNR38174.1 pilus assembly PilX N-terminal domain-containing protein [Acidobacteriota bacterium]HNT99806.1 pilus assembly PilX N-terminal domain-containing protein [Acidobacteriota bacterium]HPB27741.1 pilus assembly PilX N-terminal domain-containing protein [Acidobacteriota bacterium]HQO24827.1 pilus assembly PilX N-terminal domain-containing protein [Acidobacteriota bacterium]
MKRQLVNNKGVAMIIALLIVMALAMLASGVILITTSEVYVTRNQAYGKEAFYAAEAGLMHARRMLRNLTSREQISAMYQINPSVNDYDYGPTSTTGAKWKRLLDPNNGNTHVAAYIDTGSDRRYAVYVVNTDPTEKDTSNLPIEADGYFYVRSVGQSWMGSRKILEEMIFLDTPIVDASKDSFGGGEGNVNPQK